MESVTTEEGRNLYVDRRDGQPASKGPFYAVYTTESGDNRWGYFCGNCESLDTAMDAMGRIECNRCGNRRKATRWDASYL